MGFIESYKRLERLCGDLLNDDRRISAYIDEMISLPRGAYLVRGWDDDLKRLKHYRWVRNQIAHEPDCSEENMCEPSDVVWIDVFYSRIMNQTDPLAMYQSQNNLLRRSIHILCRRLIQRRKPLGGLCYGSLRHLLDCILCLNILRAKTPPRSTWKARSSAPGATLVPRKRSIRGTPDGTLFLYVLSKNFVQPEHFCPDGADRSRGMWYSTMWLMYSNRMV